MHSDKIDSRLHRRDDSAQAKETQLTEVMETAGAKCNGEHPQSRPNASEKDDCAENHSVSWADVHKIVKKVMQESNDKLNDRMIKFAKQTLHDASEICSVDHRKVFIEGASH